MFPVEIESVSRIEGQNNIAINVFSWEEKVSVPIYFSKRKDSEGMLDLLLLHSEDGEKPHYVLIKDFDRSYFNQTRHKERKHMLFFSRHA